MAATLALGPFSRLYGCHVVGIGKYGLNGPLADGTYVGTDGSSTGETFGEPIVSQASTTVADVGMNGVVWQKNNFTSPVLPLYATDDGNVTVTSTQYSQGNTTLQPGVPGQLGTLYTLDSGGNIASQIPDIGATQSWTGNEYVAAAGDTLRLSLPGASLRPSFWPIFANESGTSVGVKREMYDSACVSSRVPRSNHGTRRASAASHSTAFYSESTGVFGSGCTSSTASRLGQMYECDGR